MLNNVELIGRVGRDPEMRYTSNGKAVVGFSLATNEMGKDKTTWHNITAWEKLAEVCEQYVKKGDLIYLSGRIEYTENNGKYYTQIVAYTVKFLSNKSENSGSKEPPKPPTGQGQKPQSAPKQGDDLQDDDIPF